MAKDPMYPVQGATVTVGFWEPRPYSVPASQRTYVHRAWDLYHSELKTADIVAPEDGVVFYQVIMRNPTTRTLDLAWPDNGQWYMFSNFYYDTMGGVAVVVGRDTGYIYAMCHLDVDIVFKMLEGFRIPWNWEKKLCAYNDYVRYVCTFDHYKIVLRGDVIGRVGDAGYSGGPHLHMQIHEGRDYNKRIDPAELWPKEPIGSNGCGPDKGPREGAEHVPAADLSLDYIRC